MLSALRRLFPTTVPAPPPLWDDRLRKVELELAAAQANLRHLDSERLELLTEFTRTRDIVLRNVKRWGALRNAKGADGDLEGDDDLDDDLFRLKLSHGRG